MTRSKTSGDGATKRHALASKPFKISRTSPLLLSAYLHLSQIFKSKSATMLEPELNDTHTVRSMEFNCFAILANHETHQNSLTFVLAENMTMEGLSHIHQALSAAHLILYLILPIFPDQKPLVPAKPHKFPIIILSPPSCFSFGPSPLRFLSLSFLAHFQKRWTIFYNY